MELWKCWNQLCQNYVDSIGLKVLNPCTDTQYRNKDGFHYISSLYTDPIPSSKVVQLSLMIYTRIALVNIWEKDQH